MKPNKLDVFMRMVMKEARRNSLVNLLEHWGISDEEYREIESWFKAHGVSI